MVNSWARWVSPWLLLYGVSVLTTFRTVTHAQADDEPMIAEYCVHVTNVWAVTNNQWDSHTLKLRMSQQNYFDERSFYVELTEDLRGGDVKWFMNCVTVTKSDILDTSNENVFKYSLHLMDKDDNTVLENKFNTSATIPQPKDKLHAFMESWDTFTFFSLMFIRELRCYQGYSGKQCKQICPTVTIDNLQFIATISYATATCPDNYYTDIHGGQSVVRQCEDDGQWGEADKECNLYCSKDSTTAGTYYEQSDGECALCPQMFKCVKNLCVGPNIKDSRCSKCEDGYELVVTSDGGHLCQPCDPGKYYDSDTGVCATCPKVENCLENVCVGSGKGDQRCSLCEEGYVRAANSDGGQSCMLNPCNPGKYYDSDTGECATCPNVWNCLENVCVGSDKGDQRCSKCKKRYELATNSDGGQWCQPCNPGTYYDSDTRECATCPKNRNCVENVCVGYDKEDQRCSKCEEGYELATNSDGGDWCKCNRGTYKHNNKCKNCIGIKKCKVVSCTNRKKRWCEACVDNYSLSKNRKRCIPNAD